MSEKISVLHFYKRSLPESRAGVEVFIDSLCAQTAREGIDNHILTLSKEPAAEPIRMNGYAVHQAKENLFLASTSFSLSAFGKFKRLAAEASLIHYHFPNPFADMLHFASGIKKPSLLTYHSDIVKQKYLLRLYRPLQNRFLESVDRIVATSPNYMASSKVLRRFEKKTSIIPLGLDVSTYPTPTQERFEYWRARIRSPFFLFIGVARYYKGLHSALEAIKAFEDVRLVIAGSGGIERELEKRARDERIENVDFLGFVSEEDKVVLLELAGGFIFPSHIRTEAFGLALLEAAFFGKPLISCEIGSGMSYVNIDRETGIVVRPDRPDELRAAMRFILDRPEEAARMGARAKRRAERLFTAEKQGRAYLELYRELTAR